MKLISFAFLLLISLSSDALVRIEPVNPIEGQNVQLYYADCEPPFSNIYTGELFYLNQNGNTIQFVGFYTFPPPICNVIEEQYYDLGTYTEGNYQIEIYLLSADFPSPVDLINITPNEVISFGVTAPVSVPIASSFGLIIMAFLIFPLAFNFIRSIKK
ncbi:hypothetical protein MNBD_GAMMA02-893 [hydrothermal vent metagenome]|uniref:Uncharacterized protein n=1 Tax=hydrothermal vent metagenome TaxID=652676 RepID=A0A3B0VV47_9ZZZZ